MSGGSLDYVYGRVNDAVDAIRLRSRNPLHTAFADHLLLVAAALHDLEWMLSGDTTEGDEEESLRKVITPAMEVFAAIDALNQNIDALRRSLSRTE